MDGLAIDYQREDCENLGPFRCWEIVETYVDQSKNAIERTKARPDYDRLVADYGAGRFTAIICYDLGRLIFQPPAGAHEEREPGMTADSPSAAGRVPFSS